MICEYSSWLAFMVAMLRMKHGCLSFEGCERHRTAASPFPEVGDNKVEIRYAQRHDYCAQMLFCMPARKVLKVSWRR